jgi:excisionase family DNA binding protein
MSRRAVTGGSRRATKTKRREKRRYRDLKGVVQPTSPAEALWLQTRAGRRVRVEDVMTDAMALAYGGRFRDALGGDVAMGPQELLTTEHVGEALHMKADTIARKGHRGEIPAVKMGKRWWIPRAPLEAMLQPPAPQGT